MKLLTILVLSLSLLMLFGCAALVNKDNNAVNKDSSTGDAASDLNINSIDAVSSDDSDINSANTQVDETSSLISNW